jgi:hypothetical protein
MKTAIGVALSLTWGFSIVVALYAGWHLGFEEGGQLGFAIGSEREREKEAVYRGISALETLQRLPVSADAEFRETLEGDIDSALINYLSFANASPSRFDFFRVPLCADPAELASYRASNPSLSEDPALLRRIHEAVSRILSKPIASRDPGKCRVPTAA